MGLEKNQAPQLPLSSQTLSQSGGIKIENNPQFNPSNIVNVSVSQSQTEQQWAKPTIKGVEPEVIKEPIDLDVSSLALARFFYEPEEDVDPWLEVTANIFFTDPDGTHKLSLYESLWYKSKRKSATLRPGGIAALIVAVQIDDVISAIKPDVKADGRGGTTPSSSLEQLDGNNFIVSVRLIGRGKDGVVKFDGKERYTLNAGLAGLILNKL